MSCSYSYVPEEKSKKSLNVMPNPTPIKGFYVDMSEYGDKEYENAIAHIYDAAGAHIKTITIIEEIQYVEMDVAAGVYLLKIITKSGEIVTRKVIYSTIIIATVNIYSE